ncbi:hypothetical protein DRO49_00870 [Candidatus Bathyarchaeota archaeon]|nr:MAG: hypothetical protein DRO49_00870 [Candidatus Bathyarchaeota archaeon]
MARRELVEEQKRKILDALREAASRPGDLSLKEIAQITGMSRITAAKYIRELIGEGRIEVSREIGNVVLYRIKKR